MEPENNYYQQVTDYVAERAQAEGSALLYLKENYGDKLVLQELIYNIVSLSDEFIEITNDAEEIFDDDDVKEYLVDKTGYSTDIIGLILWFKECFMMKEDCITFSTKCPKCNHDEMFQKETEGVLYGLALECKKCGKKCSFDEYFELED